LFLLSGDETESKEEDIVQSTEEVKKESKPKSEEYWRDRMQLDEEDELIKIEEPEEKEKELHSEKDHNLNNQGQNGPHQHSRYSEGILEHSSSFRSV